jgi:hypothetical protein
LRFLADQLGNFTFAAAGGGESGYVASDPRNPDIFYAGSYGETLTKAVTAIRGGSGPHFSVLLAAELHSLRDMDILASVEDIDGRIITVRATVSARNRAGAQPKLKDTKKYPIVGTLHN